MVTKPTRSSEPQEGWLLICHLSQCPFWGHYKTKHIWSQVAIGTSLFVSTTSLLSQISESS